MLSTTTRVVVALDFGTMFSSFTYGKPSERDEVFKVYEWPSASRVGAKPYCKMHPLQHLASLSSSSIGVGLVSYRTLGPLSL
ncbi:hypothetical protein GOP47_0018473 [Adiantum capillus-veneris]|uniref:Uncharacterized protein n=1 Tax=Adiantum capillus-veneris TaxID=13818 RepID=A0A9D4UEI5_ADICA|nr:hypothetical protein GOP47_0018473 [Adiantum capillus-veneris]